MVTNIIEPCAMHSQTTLDGSMLCLEMWNFSFGERGDAIKITKRNFRVRGYLILLSSMIFAHPLPLVYFLTTFFFPNMVLTVELKLTGRKMPWRKERNYSRGTPHLHTSLNSESHSVLPPYMIQIHI